VNDRQNDTPEITQEMIALFDDYTHLSLDRRKFLDNLAKLAGSMSAATAAAALMASNTQAQGLVSETDERLEIEDVTYPGATGEMQGHLAVPKEGGPLRM
jgi:carboxymethylenebutenolidase